jgi:NCAIR mutase (PurE)-related protein
VDRERIENILEEVGAGRMKVAEALEQLRNLPFEDLGFAKIDTHRDLRTGCPEVIFCQGKTAEQIRAIVRRHPEADRFLMATRATAEMYDAIREERPDAVYHELARIVLVGKGREKISDGEILVVSAGTSDLPVAEEAAVTAEAMGNPVERLYDVGVAGIHRLLDRRDRLFRANVVITVAGMEGALASIVGGLVNCPVVAVPTSVGYGASFGGLSALLTMLNSCAPGVVVVNIDNGFGAGYVASLINARNCGYT